MKVSAGILLFRERQGRVEVLLVHPGGPYWAKKDTGAWTIPKGAVDEGEELLTAARREFEEETGSPAKGEAVPLMPRRQPGGKVVHAWAVRGDLDATAIRSTTFTMEWPPRSGRQQEFPEVDRGVWLTLDEARGKILKGQAAFLDDLAQLLRGEGPR